MNTLAPVILSSYDAAWGDIFSQEKDILLRGFGENSLSIEHIGSTAIPGATAKPEIDMMIGLVSLQDALGYMKPFEKLGYVYFQKFEQFVPERRYFRKSSGIIPLVHVHMVEKGSDFWSDHILFRDYLRSNPEDAKRYSDLKKELVTKFDGDREEYSNGKNAFIMKTLDRAKRENFGS